MEERKLKIYAVTLLSLGSILFFLLLLKIKELNTFLKANIEKNTEISSSLLTYIFLILLFAIFISFFILIFFGIKKEEKEITSNINIPDLDEQKIEESLSDGREEILKAEQKAQEIIKELAQETDTKKLFNTLLKRIAKEYHIVQGLAYLKDKKTNKFKMLGKYAYYVLDKAPEFELGEGLPGQVAEDKQTLYINNIPKNYVTVLSGLGSSTPKYMAIIPIVKNNQTIAIFEITTFSDISAYIDALKNILNNFLAEKLSE